MPLFKKISIILLLLLGLSNVGKAQKIVINEADSAWMGQEIPSKALSEKKFSFNRRWYQNLVTRFNYYYNANRTLNQALSGAQRIHQDNFDSILTFYPYSPEDILQFESQLDSVILNAGIGIEIHDPRGKWIDDLYFLVGKANYLKENDTEAIASFKYIIKNQGEKDEENRPAIIGGRGLHSEKNISIIMPEKKKNPSHPPARNDAFIWLIKAYRQAGNQDAADALYNALQSDPQLPERLERQLAALKAEYFLQGDEPDSVFTPLKEAIALQPDKHLKARWQFILAQLYEETGNWEMAFQNFEKVNSFSPDPLMSFYAQLNQTRIRVLRNLQDFKRSGEPLLAMAKKEKYSRYRSIIYYNLGKLALQAGYPEEGIHDLEKSLHYNPERTKVHFRAYSLLANYFFDHFQYRPAKLYYDSAAALAPSPHPQIDLRKEALTDVVKNLDVINKQDSLQALALLPRDSLMNFMNDIIKDSLKMRRKRNRILEGPAEQKNGLFGHRNQKEQEAREHKKNSRGGWYFYNNTAKSQGFSEFRAHWGNRELRDNWRLSHPNQPVIPSENKQKPILATTRLPENDQEEGEQMLQTLLEPLPLTPGKLNISDSLKMEARHQNINILFTKLQSDSATLMAIDSLLKWHPENPYLPTVYYKLFLIYSRLPDKEKAAHYKQLLLSRFGATRYAALLQNESGKNTGKTLAAAIMHLYDSAYISYLTGSYNKVSKLRDSALYLDSRNEQKGRFNLLQAMTILKTKSDSAGIAALNRVIREEASDTPIVEQARRILNALQHKEELVEHLMNLQLKEPSPASEKKPFIPSEEERKEARAREKAKERADSLAFVARLQKARADSIAAAENLKKAKADSLALVRNQNKAKADSIAKVMRREKARADSAALALRLEKEKADSIFKIRKLERAKADSLAMAERLEKEKADSLAMAERLEKEKADSMARADSMTRAKPTPLTPYKIERQVPYFVILSFNHINGDLIQNALNAFAEYNRKDHASDSIEVSSFVLSHNQVILIFRLFKNETDALLYYRELRKKAAVQIIPKVPESYYRLFFISRSNFVLLNSTQDFKGYLNFFYQHYK